MQQHARVWATGAGMLSCGRFAESAAEHEDDWPTCSLVKYRCWFSCWRTILLSPRLKICSRHFAILSADTCSRTMMQSTKAMGLTWLRKIFSSTVPHVTSLYTSTSRVCRQWGQGVKEEEEAEEEEAEDEERRRRRRRRGGGGGFIQS